MDVAGGWYHVTARGIERRTIFEDVRDHEHFLVLLPEMVGRYGVEVHAYVLMGNRIGRFLNCLAQTAEQLSTEALWAIILSAAFVKWLREKVLRPVVHDAQVLLPLETTPRAFLESAS